MKISLVARPLPIAGALGALVLAASACAAPAQPDYGASFAPAGTAVAPVSYTHLTLPTKERV